LIFFFVSKTTAESCVSNKNLQINAPKQDSYLG